MANTKNSNYDYDAAAEEARRREEERRRKIAELEQKIAQLDAEREKYYQARGKTVETINTLDQMAKSLDDAVTCLHENFRINGVNADKGKLDVQIEEVTSTAKILKNNTLSNIDTNIENLSKQINATITELNGLHTAGESLYPEDIPKALYDDGIINIYNTGTRGVTGDGKTYINFENFTSLFTETIDTANSKMSSVNELVDSIIGIVPSNFTGIGTLKGLETNFFNISTNVSQIYTDLITTAQKIAQIEKTYSSELNALETNLSDIYKTGGAKEFIASISNLLTSGEINAAALTTLVLPNLVRQGNINISQLGSITSNLYCDNIINNSDVGNIIGELKRTNLNYAVTSDNMNLYQEELNNKYGYEFSYIEHHDQNKNNCWFKIDSKYEYKNSDINEILKPMYDAGIIDASDVKEITQSVTIFNKETGSPDIYNNQQYSPHTKSYDDSSTNGRFKVTVGNLSYEVTDKDRELIKGIKGYENFFTGDEAYDNAIADVAITDFATAITTKEIGGIKTVVDEANAVASVAINRTESIHFTTTDENGGGLISQYIRGDQYQTYNSNPDNGYLEYINGNGYQTVETAITDVMNGTRVTDCVSFSVPEGQFTAENKITQGDGNTFTYSTGLERIVNPMDDKIVPYTGQVYERAVQPNETPGSAIMSVNTQNQEKSQITADAYQEITDQATKFANITTSNQEVVDPTITPSTTTDTITDSANSNSYTNTETNISNTTENNISSVNTSSNTSGVSYTYPESTDLKGSKSSLSNILINDTNTETNISNTTENNISPVNTSSNTSGVSYTYPESTDFKDNNKFSSNTLITDVFDSLSDTKNLNTNTNQEYNTNNTQYYIPKETPEPESNHNTILDKEIIQEEKTDFASSSNIDITSNDINASKEMTPTMSVPSSETNTTNNNKINLSGLLFGSSALAGLGFGSKKIHDKKKSEQDEEE